MPADSFFRKEFEESLSENAAAFHPGTASLRHSLYTERSGLISPAAGEMPGSDHRGGKPWVRARPGAAQHRPRTSRRASTGRP